MRKGLLSDIDYYCDHIKASDEKDISCFEVNNPKLAYGLEDYIKNYAWNDEQSGVMRTYVVRDHESDELVGYFSIKAGMVSLNERKEVDKTTGTERIYFDTMPGIEIADFAINDVYKKNHNDISGLGLLIFYEFILKIVRKIAESLGVKFLYIYALPYISLIDRYTEYYHFSRLPDKLEDELHKRLKPHYDDQCIFMYQPL